MALVRVRHANTYWGTVAAGSPDGSDGAPFNYTWAQVLSSAAAGNTVSLHPACQFDVTTSDGFIMDGVIGPTNMTGIIERWDVPGFEGIFPTFNALEWVPSGAWVDVGSGRWQCTFDGALGASTRNWSTGIEIQGWWGLTKGKNSRADGLAAGTNRRLATIGECTAAGEYHMGSDGGGTPRMRLTVYTGGANPTTFFGSYAVHGGQGIGISCTTFCNVKYITFKSLMALGGSIAHFWPSADRVNEFLEFHDMIHLCGIGSGWSWDTYPPGTAVGATTNAAGYAGGATVITLASAGTGSIVGTTNFGDAISFTGDSNIYRVVANSGASNVSDGGTVTLAAPGLLQAIPASATAITVRKVADNRDMVIYRPAGRSRYPTQPRVVNNVLSQEINPQNGVILTHNVKRIDFWDVRFGGYSHGQVFGAQQDGRTEVGNTQAHRDIRFLTSRHDDPGDGFGAYNTLNCGISADYQRGIGFLSTNFYFGPLKIIGQRTQSQLGGSGIFACIFPPGSSIPYSEGTLPSNNYNASNGVVLQNLPSSGSLPISDIRIVGAMLDATGNIALGWSNDSPGTPNNSLRVEGCLIYDPSQVKYRAAANVAQANLVAPNASIHNYDFTSGDGPQPHVLRNNTFVKTDGGPVLALKRAGSDPLGTLCGMLDGYTATELNALAGWGAEGNVQYTSLAAAGFDASGTYTGPRLAPTRRGASSRGYR